MPNIYRAEMGQPPMDIDGGSVASPKKVMPAPKKPATKTPAPSKPRAAADPSARHYKGMANATKQK
jgi:hypothetical protein